MSTFPKLPLFFAIVVAIWRNIVEAGNCGIWYDQYNNRHTHGACFCSDEAPVVLQSCGYVGSASIAGTTAIKL